MTGREQRKRYLEGFPTSAVAWKVPNMLISPRYGGGRPGRYSFQRRRTNKRFSFIGRLLARTGNRSAIRMLRPELKFQRFQVGPPAAASTSLAAFGDSLVLYNGATSYPNLVLLNGLSEGDDANNREGRQVFWKQMALKIRVVQASTVFNGVTAGLPSQWTSPAATGTAAANNLTSCQLIMFIDKQPNAAIPVLGNLFDTNNAPYTDMYYVNLDYRERFRIVKQKRINLNSWLKPMALVSMFKVWKRGLKTTYIGSNSLIANIATNALYLVCISPDLSTHPLFVAAAGNNTGYISGAIGVSVSVSGRFSDP